MLDIQFIRDNPDLVTEKSKQKGYSVNVEKLLELDDKRRELIRHAEDLRQRHNTAAAQTKGTKPTEEQISEGRKLKEDITDLEARLVPVDEDYIWLLKQIPNMPIADVPVGHSEAENVVAREVGEKKPLDFVPKTHWDLAETRNLIDKRRAAKVSGARFAYIKGGLVELQFAIVQYVLKTMTDPEVIEKIIKDNNLTIVAKPFMPILPPYMLKTDIFDAMDRLEPRDDRYRVGEVDDELWLQGSAEHVLGPMYMDEIIPEDQLPIRYIGYATSFRREAGTYGKDTEGIIRMHQFDKLEMEVFSTGETGLAEHTLLIALQEYMVNQIGVPYRVLQKCTYDIGKPNAQGIDIDMWFPGQNKYRETHTADYMTDYQARRLKTRVRKTGGKIELLHSNDATAFALGRTMAAIMENYQTDDGKIVIPEVLRPFMNGKTEI